MAPKPKQLVWLELPGDQLEEVEPGATIQIALTGKVVSVTERQDGKKVAGSLEMECSKVQVVSGENEFSDLVEEED